MFTDLVRVTVASLAVCAVVGSGTSTAPGAPGAVVEAAGQAAVQAAGRSTARTPVQTAEPSDMRTQREQAPDQITDKPESDGFSDARLAKLADAPGARGAAVRGVVRDGTRVVVEITGASAAVQAAVSAAGGEIHAVIADNLVEAEIPTAALGDLQSAAGVDLVRVPAQSGADASESVAGSYGDAATRKTGMDGWHAAGLRGARVRVGIIDSFNGSTYQAALNAGEVPAPSGYLCLRAGVACDTWASPSSHGIGVAEVIHDMAPDASVYVASARTAGDLVQVVDWMAARGVTVISRSLTAEFDGPGDGTGPIAEAVAYAVSKGIVWVNSAGNSARGNGYAGSYWRGGAVDADADGWLEFAQGDELLDFDCGAFINGLRWSDWGATGRTDYDLYVYDAAGNLVGKSENYQGQGADPIEIPATAGCQAGQKFSFGIKVYDRGAGTAGDVLEIMINAASLEYGSSAYSAAGPAADVDIAGALAVGAVDPADGTTIAPYSSQGPTNDGRIKPDISAASCMSSFTYRGNGDGCFNGTSAATPVVAGAVAVLQGSDPSATPAQVTRWLIDRATVDRGAAGPDNVYGGGELVLPRLAGQTDPAGNPGGTTRPANDDLAQSQRLYGRRTSTVGTTVGATREEGEGEHCSGGGASSIWFTWRAARTSRVVVDLGGSDFDTVLAAYRGRSVSRLAPVASNDDAGERAASRIVFRAVAGVTYRIAVAGYGDHTGRVALALRQR